MAASRSMTPIRCVACQRRVLEAFSGLRISSVSRLRSSAQRAQATAFSTTTAFRSDSNPFQIAESRDPSSKQSEESPDSKVEDSTPWYLRLEDAREEDNPFAHRQRIPAIPDSPPPMLEPLLKHLSIDIGLDYLNLMDLRQVDPPPAFGANLFMIFGTARSEKHLNVSADRLCRWLRSEYKLTPFADGLLGRQELKLKLKRKARRSKMMSAAGGSPLSEFQMDDGTRTGWVCINVGDVEPGGTVTEEQGADDGFVGFGKRTDNAKVVVQMMTEEKRVELDLETLWQGILRGSARRQRAMEEEDIPPERAGTLSQPKTGGRRRVLMQPRNPRFHVRAFSTSARPRFASETSVLSQDRTPGLGANVHSTDRLEQKTAIDKSDLQSFIARTLEVQDRALAAGLAYLSELSNTSCIEALGRDHTDRDSTDFLRDWYAKFPATLKPDHYVAQLSLLHAARSVRHPGYPTSQAVEVLKRMEAACVPIPQQLFLFVACEVLDDRSVSSFEDVPIKNYKTDTSDAHAERHLKHFTSAYRAYERKLHVALDVLERMEAHGFARLPLRFFIRLHSVMRNSTLFHGANQRRLTAGERHKLLLQYWHAVRLIFAPDALLPRPLLLDMLRAWSHTRDWKLFWKAWRSIAAEGFARDAEMYALLFDALALQRDQKQAWRALTEFLPEMARENPPVSMDRPVALALLRVMRVLGFDPRVDFGPRHEEVARVWDRCWETAGLEPLPERPEDADA